MIMDVMAGGVIRDPKKVAIMTLDERLSRARAVCENHVLAGAFCGVFSTSHHPAFMYGAICKKAGIITEMGSPVMKYIIAVEADWIE